MHRYSFYSIGGVQAKAFATFHNMRIDGVAQLGKIVRIDGIIKNQLHSSLRLHSAKDEAQAISDCMKHGEAIATFVPREE